MASGGGKEHRMVFDIRGKRRNVVKVVYAVLAVLMGLSLFLVVGPLNIGEIFGNESGSTSEAASRLEDEAVKIERKLAKEPENEDLLLRLTRNHTSTANILAERGPNEEVLLTVDARAQYQKAASTWDEYLAATQDPNLGAAQLMAGTLFSLANTSQSYGEAEDNITAAAEAQKIVADKRPSLGALSTAALYTLYTFDYAEAEKLLEEAKKLAPASERAALESQFKETKKAAVKFEKEYKEVQKLEQQGRSKGKKGAEESLQNPLGLGGGSGIAE